MSRIPWNKGLKLSKMAQYCHMGFQAGNKHWNNPESIKTQLKTGDNRIGVETQFVKGVSSWSKGKGHLFVGNKNPSWKGGLENRKPNEKKHLCSKYVGWMKQVKNRDNWKCRMANKDCNGRLEAHHILNWIDYPELRYEINNGITLCHSHHPRRREEEKRLIPTFVELVSVSSNKI
jgi:hypothetical protein